jgi:multimeric flavodoxin WrbA
MLNRLVNGMREAGAAVETVNLREKRIKIVWDALRVWL